MSEQVNIKLSETMLVTARQYIRMHGFDTLQDFIRELLREKLFEKEEETNSIFTAIASEKSLAKHWLTKEEEKAWAHIQEGT